MRPIQGVEAKRGSMVDPAIEKYLLGLQRAMDAGSDSFHARAREALGSTQSVHDRFLRLDSFWLQNCATQRHAT